MNLDCKYSNTFELALSFGFNTKEYFFKHVNYVAHQHSINFIMGRNGIGKSTLLRILQGKIYAGEQIEGSIAFNHQEHNLALSETKQLLHNMSRLVSQNYNNMLALDFTVAENIAAAQLQRYPSFALLPKTCAYQQMLESAGIFLTHPVHQLSGGQRQILAITMAIQKPIKLLLLDEPTAALDETNTQIVMSFLHQLAQIDNITMICISHDPELIRTYSAGNYSEIVKNEHNERFIERRSHV